MKSKLLIVVAVLAVSGCGESASGGGTPSVVATTTQAADLARAVAGDRAEVRSLLKPNSDPHAYEPRAGDVKAIARADLMVRSGGEMDEWLQEAQRGAGCEAPVVTLGERTREEPHWWQDPRAALHAVDVLRRGLTTADAGGKAQYAANAERYGGELRRLDAAIARCIASIPVAKRKLVTTHDALGAYARRYGLEVIATVIPSRSTRGQASAGETADLVRAIKHEKVPAIFAESSVRSDVEDAIAREAGARVAPPLWADSLGPRGSSGATYIASMEANTHTIATALGSDLSRCP